MAKRGVDIVVSFLAIIILALPCVIIAILVKASSKGPAIYWSTRIGRDSKPFQMPKFRSMRIDTPEVATDKLNSPKQYITEIGAFLRKTSLDELPQLYSVFTGDMSLVGPRPALHNQFELIDLRMQKGIDRMRPGITGLAQINGRDDIELAQKVALDLEYMKRANMGLDIQIIVLTFFSIIKSKNVAH